MELAARDTSRPLTPEEVKLIIYLHHNHKQHTAKLDNGGTIRELLIQRRWKLFSAIGRELWMCRYSLRDIFVAPPNHFLSSFPSFHPDVRKRLHTPTTTIFLEVTWSEREDGFYNVSTLSAGSTILWSPTVRPYKDRHTHTNTHATYASTQTETLQRCWKGG